MYVVLWDLPHAYLYHIHLWSKLSPMLSLAVKQMLLILVCESSVSLYIIRLLNYVCHNYKKNIFQDKFVIYACNLNLCWNIDTFWAAIFDWSIAKTFKAHRLFCLCLTFGMECHTLITFNVLDFDQIFRSVEVWEAGGGNIPTTVFLRIL